MKRLSKEEFIRRRNYDVNRVRIYAAGQDARTANRSVQACPRFELFAGLRARELAEVWKKGWRDRDAELQTPWLPYKEES